MIIRNLHRREEINQYRQRSIVFEVHGKPFIGCHYFVKIRQDKVYTVYFVLGGKEFPYNTLNDFISESVDKIWEENFDWFD
jgi:hypothetical protein